MTTGRRHIDDDLKIVREKIYEASKISDRTLRFELIAHWEAVEEETIFARYFDRLELQEITRD